MTKTAVLFRAGAQFLDAENNLTGYCPEPILKSDLYPLVCRIISGDVARQHAIHDTANVTDFLQNNAHLQGVTADVMQMQEDGTTRLIGVTVETLEKKLAEASLIDLRLWCKIHKSHVMCKCLAAKLESFLPH